MAVSLMFPLKAVCVVALVQPLLAIRGNKVDFAHEIQADEVLSAEGREDREEIGAQYPKEENLQIPKVGSYMETYPTLDELLQDAGIPSETEEPPLCLATRKDNPKEVELLLKKGANADMKCDGWTPLHIAVSEGHGEVIPILLEHGANVNAKAPALYGPFTPLHLAAENHFTRIIPILMQHGANVDAKTDEGKTPLHLAADKGYGTVVALLLESGANANAKDDEGKTPLNVVEEHWWHNTNGYLKNPKGYDKAREVLKAAGGV